MTRTILPFFSPAWIAGWIGAALLISGAIWMAKRLSPEQERRFRLGLAGLLALRFVVHQSHLLIIGEWMAAEHLPLHLCGISSVLAAFLLWKPKQLGYEYLILLGLPGAFHAFLTPELGSALTLYTGTEYYLSHGGIWLAGLYLTFVTGLRIRRGSWWKLFLLGQGLMLVVGAINLLLDANYMYLCTRPLVANPFLIGPWPWYLLGFEVAGLLHIGLFYFLFYRKPKSTENTALT